jgi:predicted Zn-dependent protease
VDHHTLIRQAKGGRLVNSSRAWKPLALGGLLAAAVAVGLGCGGVKIFGPPGEEDSQSSGEGEGPGRRSQSLALTPAQELALGRKAFQEVLEENEGRVERSGPNFGRVEVVASRIIEVVKTNEPLRREINIHLKDAAGDPWRFEWEFAVIDTNQINAFCLPGGKIVVYTGLLRFVDQNAGSGHSDDWLATVLSHEIAHALAHHASERIARRSLSRQASNYAAGDELHPADQRRINGLLGFSAGGGKLGDLAFDRQQESEADHIGVFLMTFAGYDPVQAIRFWEAMASRSGSNVPEILSDHPSDARRIAQMRGWVTRAQDAWAAWKAGRIAPGGER